MFAYTMTMHNYDYDLNLQNFALEYGYLMDLDNIDSLRKMHLKQLIATLVKSNTDNFSTIIEVFARVQVAKRTVQMLKDW